MSESDAGTERLAEELEADIIDARPEEQRNTIEASSDQAPSSEETGLSRDDFAAPLAHEEVQVNGHEDVGATAEIQIAAAEQEIEALATEIQPEPAPMNAPAESDLSRSVTPPTTNDCRRACNTNYCTRRSARRSTFISAGCFS